MAERSPEPWLRGPLADTPPFLMPLFHSFAQVREDLQQHLAGLTTEQIWRDMPGGSLGFHVQHLTGSVDRLTTYLLGDQLSVDQLRAFSREKAADTSAAELIAAVDAELSRCERRVRMLDQSMLFEARAVGRQQLPTTVLGLLTHLAEHTQRHLGQVITLSHMLRAAV